MKRRTLTALAALLLAVTVGLPGCELSLERLTNGGAVPAPSAEYTGLQDGFRYTKTTLTGQEQYLYDQLLAGLKDQAETIDGLYPDNDMIQKAIDAIDRDYPELFWFSGTGQIETTLLGERAMEAVYRPTYAMDAAQRAETQAKIDQWTADCLATIDTSASQYAQALGVYTYLIDHADYQDVGSNSIVNIMVGGAGLCGCYAKTMQYVLNQLGIQAAYITGQAKGQSHAWNLVWLDGTPCWVDPTWGDPVFAGGEESQGPAYAYFGLTTADLLRTHTIDGSIPVPECVSNDANYFYRSGLYFTSYHASALTSAIQRAIAAGEGQCSVRYSDEAYSTACAQLHSIFRQAAQAAGVGTVVPDSLWYSRDDTMGVLTFVIPS